MRVRQLGDEFEGTIVVVVARCDPDNLSRWLALDGLFELTRQSRVKKIKSRHMFLSVEYPENGA